MAFKRKFITDYGRLSMADFTEAAQRAEEKTAGNPDFKDAPVDFEKFKVKVGAVVAAYPEAKVGNQVGLARFREARVGVTPMLRILAEYATPLIGGNEERMLASGLALTKEPHKRPEALSLPVKPSLQKGPGVGMLVAKAKSSRAARGLEGQISLDNKKTWSDLVYANGFTLEFSALPSGAVAYGRVRYWNNRYKGAWSQEELYSLIP